METTRQTIRHPSQYRNVVRWQGLWRELLVARARLAGATEAQAQAKYPNVDLQVLDVSFDAIDDPEERAYFMNLPTSFVLKPEEVDNLREVAGRVLRQSAEYGYVVRELGGTTIH